MESPTDTRPEDSTRPADEIAVTHGRGSKLQFKNYEVVYRPHRSSQRRDFQGFLQCTQSNPQWRLITSRRPPHRSPHGQFRRRAPAMGPSPIRAATHRVRRIVSARKRPLRALFRTRPQLSNHATSQGHRALETSRRRPPLRGINPRLQQPLQHDRRRTSHTLVAAPPC